MTFPAGTEMRFEDMGLPVQTRARDGFLALAAKHPARFRVIGGIDNDAASCADFETLVGAPAPQVLGPILSRMHARHPDGKPFRISDLPMVRALHAALARWLRQT